ncbi:MAG: hypothetical protein ACYC9I_05210, partial [Desulfuromonadales bacterium]
PPWFNDDGAPGNFAIPDCPGCAPGGEQMSTGYARTVPNQLIYLNIFQPYLAKNRQHHQSSGITQTATGSAKL